MNDAARTLPDTYGTPRPTGEPNWAWVDLWEQSNPNPGGEDFDDWYEQRRTMHDRVWVAYCLPGFAVFDWPEVDVANARRLVARHVCGVCGRRDDPGCGMGC